MPNYYFRYGFKDTYILLGWKRWESTGSWFWKLKIKNLLKRPMDFFIQAKP